ncbi:Serine kinase [Balamuthia mandrillaris]
MKFDATGLRYMSKEEFRVLTAVEMGMKNHDLVPTQLISSLAKLKRGGAFKFLGLLHKNKLVVHENKKYDGYRLTYSGYDYLALNVFRERGVLAGVGTQIGVGKESDVFLVITPDEQEVVLKLHRLGRISFRAVKQKRDYLQHRKSASWMYLSRLAALKEFAYMKVLYDNGFPVPKPIDVNRHCVVMERVNGYPFSQVRELVNPGSVYNNLMRLIVKLARYGLVHCDFNEFNLLINDKEEITLIDFPQMVSADHYNAEMYFDRDVQCIRTFFLKRFGFDGQSWPRFSEVVQKHHLDVEVEASGYTKNNQERFETLLREQEGDDVTEEGSESEESEEANDGTENDEQPTKDDDGEEGEDKSADEKDEEKTKKEESEPITTEQEGAKENAEENANKVKQTQTAEEDEEEAVVDQDDVKRKVKRSLHKKRGGGLPHKNPNSCKNKGRRQGNKARVKDLW